MTDRIVCVEVVELLPAVDRLGTTTWEALVRHAFRKSLARLRISERDRARIYHEMLRSGDRHLLVFASDLDHRHIPVLAESAPFDRFTAWYTSRS